MLVLGIKDRIVNSNCSTATPRVSVYTWVGVFYSLAKSFRILPFFSSSTVNISCVLNSLQRMGQSNVLLRIYDVKDFPVHTGLLEIRKGYFMEPENKFATAEERKKEDEEEDGGWRNG